VAAGLPQNQPVAGRQGVAVDIPHLSVAADAVGEHERCPAPVRLVVDPDLVGGPGERHGGILAARGFFAQGFALDRLSPSSVFLNRRSSTLNFLRVRIALTVNDEAREALAPVHKTLLEVLREDLGLTGTKHGCELGECGTCTVLVDGEPVLSCLVLPVEVEGRRITTVEGMAQGGRLHPLQEAFAELGAAQCGYCTPGILLTATALLAERPSPTRQEVKEALAGNLCRCTGYTKILDAVELAALRMGRQEART
jgi:carbon-monoxide dehydrogenase small subunit